MVTVMSGDIPNARKSVCPSPPSLPTHKPIQVKLRWRRHEILVCYRTGYAEASRLRHLSGLRDGQQHAQVGKIKSKFRPRRQSPLPIDTESNGGYSSYLYFPQGPFCPHQRLAHPNSSKNQLWGWLLWPLCSLSSWTAPKKQSGTY